MSRIIVLDTETTGLEPSQGHRVIEIGCVEVINRKLTGNHYHVYIQPEREVEASAIEVHGITNEFLADKPLFSHIAEDFLNFVNGAELVIHNAPFDVGFINHEFNLLGAQSPGKIEDYCKITDSLALARRKHPGQRNSLDALCKRYFVDNSSRTLHGALLDSEILADVYLTMTGGQTALSLGSQDGSGDGESGASMIRRLSTDRPPLKVLKATAEEISMHQEKLAAIEKKAGNCLWKERFSEENS
ncbi:DNA polymerase III subunit epsilon [Sansalvadorimonas sp. 2012CJ34-2]|uniref:DNA polymerase III subunit epsilon n=1 Tax=Parendozoicomonas callyspongiae TaxID=2942213 RepID=A0ABT0PEZ9_9GAMM|nr:DNA polymerase III subunit epsilon [Sansalvadorimonas sp. 2012CJ34-2]MCL6269841.1 DNA polymerase III subunit epsilon [Sansalvadorimonas sp. 2012CJ34-2]